MICIVSVTFGEKYLTGMVTTVPPYQISVLLKIIFFISLKTTKITSKIQISEVCDLTLTFRSHWSCDIQFHKYAFHINRNFL